MLKLILMLTLALAPISANAAAGDPVPGIDILVRKHHLGAQPDQRLIGAGTGTFDGSYLGFERVFSQQSGFMSDGETWEGVTPFGENYSYAISQPVGIVAIGMLMDWNGSQFVPVLALFDCGDNLIGNDCTATTMVMESGPFAGQVFDLSNEFDFSLVSAPPPVPSLSPLGIILAMGLLGFAGYRKSRA
jgi:hypothetical protein